MQNDSRCDASVDVIVPFCGRSDLLLVCLHALAQLPPRGVVYVVDDGSPASEAQVAKTACGSLPLQLRWISLPQRTGFVHAANCGWSESRARIAVILNSDTIPAPGLMGRLSALLQSREDLAAIAPTSTNVRDLYQYRSSVRAATAGGAAITLAPYLTAMCMAVRKDAVRGELFDAVYAPGYFEDLDLCCRLRLRGWQLAITERESIPHVGGASFASDPNTPAVVARNYATFAARWSWLPDHADLLSRLHAVDATEAPACS